MDMTEFPRKGSFLGCFKYLAEKVIRILIIIDQIFIAKITLIIFLIINKYIGAGEMVQWLRALSAFAEVMPLLVAYNHV